MEMTSAVTREGDTYVARCLEVEAVGQGDTVEHALANLRDVVEAYLGEEPFAKPPPPLITWFEVGAPHERPPRGRGGVTAGGAAG